MGVGKTIQTLAYIHYNVFVLGFRNTPSLIIVPPHLMSNWMNEIASFNNFCPPNEQLVCIDIPERPAQRIWNQRYQMVEGHFHICLNSFSRMKKGQSLDSYRIRREYSWFTVIVDEAHKLKTNKAVSSRVLKDLTYVRLIFLSGTIVQNNPRELQNVMSFITPGIFDSEKLKGEESEWDKFVDVLKIVYLKRYKRKVFEDLDLKQRVTIYLEMGVEQKKIYDKIDKAKDDDDESHMTKEVKLKYACVHPWIKDDSIKPETPNILDYTGVSCKFKTIEYMLNKIYGRKDKKKGEENKVLIFSEFTENLKILREFLKLKGFDVAYLDGEVKGAERQIVIDNFQSVDPPYTILLLSAAAFSTGINLQRANVVIFLTARYNVQEDFQAEDRAWRNGQRRKVWIFYLLVRDTIESKSIESIRKTKKEMDEAITRQASFQLQMQGGGNAAEIKKGMIDAKEHVIEGFKNIDKRFMEIGATEDLGLEENGDAVMEGVEHDKKKREEMTKDNKKIGRRKKKKSVLPGIPLKFSDWVESDINRFGELMLEFMENKERVCETAAKELNKERANVDEFYDMWVNSNTASDSISTWKKKIMLAKKEKELKGRIGERMPDFVKLPWNAVEIKYDMFRNGIYSEREDRLLIYCMQMVECNFDEVCRYIKHHYKLRHELFLKSRTKEEIIDRGTYLLGLLKKQFDKTE